MKIGILGTDTSHAPAFTRWLREDGRAEVVSAWHGDFATGSVAEALVQRFEREMTSLEVNLCDSAHAVMETSDAIMALSPACGSRIKILEDAARRGIPVFFDKPLALSASSALELEEKAVSMNAAVFCSSALRFLPAWIAGMKKTHEWGGPTGVTVRGPIKIRKDIPKYYFYAVHCVELLVDALGPDWQSCRLVNGGMEHFQLRWRGGSMAELVLSSDPGFSARVETRHGTWDVEDLERSHCSLYGPLLERILDFFQGNPPPVSLRQSVAVCEILDALGH